LTAPVAGSIRKSLRHSFRDLFRFLSGIRGEFLSLQTKLARSFVVAPAVSSGSGIVSVGGVYVQVSRLVLVALGHSVLHDPASTAALMLGVCHFAASAAAQSDTERTAWTSLTLAQTIGLSTHASMSEAAITGM